MTEVNAVKYSGYLSNSEGSIDGSEFKVISPPIGTLEVSNDGGQTWIDVDASWDGQGSLDDHRQKELAKVEQPGFGDAGKVKTDG